MIAALTNHLWQSTLFVLAAGVVAFALRKNCAHIRHRVWVIASLKFLVPFAALMSLGSALPARTPSADDVASSALEAPALSVTVDRFAQPFTDDVFFPAAASANTTPSTNWIAVAIIGVWAIGFIAVVFMRVRGWWRIRTAVRTSVPVSVVGGLPVRSAPGLLEPGVVGLWRPVLLVPAGIEQQLTPRQLDAVLTHELCHVQRRDNLTSAIHMVVEAAFWFHPLVWFVGAKLIDERERACDEHVLRVCGEPRVYAESILNVCKLYVESPIACVSGVSGLGSPKRFFGGGGADLKRRITAIVNNRIGLRLSVARKVTLAIVAMLAIALPLVVGVVIAPLRVSAAAASADNPAPAGGQDASANRQQKFDVASVKACAPDAPPAGRGSSPASPGYLFLQCYTLRQMVNLAYDASSLLNKPYGPGGTPDVPELVRGGPSWASSDKFTIEAKGDGVKELEALTTATGQWAIKDPLMGSMLRALLEDRFQLKTHRATETQTMYALTVAKGGHKMKPLASGDCWEYEAGKPLQPHPANVPMCGMFGGDGWGSSKATGLKIRGPAPEGRSFVDYLFFMLRRMVIDRTGLDGRYSFTFDFAPDDTTPGVTGRGGPVPEKRPETFKSSATIFKALEEQLGLKLEPIKAPAEYIVIDSAQRPRPNDPASARSTAGKPADSQGRKR